MILFRETQRFRQPWLWLVLICSALATLLPLIVSFAEKNAPGQAAMLGPGLLVLFLIGANFTGFYITKLETVITSDGVYFKWSPFFKTYRFYSLQEIQGMKIGVYNKPRFGLHKDPDFGRVHIVNGSNGISFKAGQVQRVFIGTRRVAAMRHVLEHHFK
ncbi:MAG: hypothetical protein EOO01_15380 [Chitinophagaceae bacterium]|nr:MAG: hypothetical protein EOO01_15380 [Chitinophagaceae bacterium]